MAIGALQTGYTTLYGKIAGLGTQNGQTRGSNFREHIDGTEKKAPYQHLAQNGTITYKGVTFVCDKDRNPEQYVNIISKLDDILGPGKAKEIVIFTCPCTLQVILSHFGDVQLTTQAKKAARDDVQRLTDVANYDAHQDQLKTICSKIHYRSYEKMKQRIAQLSTCPDDIPSTNILSLFGYLESQNPQWIDGINERLSAED